MEEMGRYLSAEWGRTVRRPYFAAFLLTMAGLAAALAAFLGPALGDLYHGSFGESVALLVPFLPLGLYLAVISADLTFCDQYKHGTLKQEAAYGLPRGRIYLGKLLTAAGVGLLACFVAVLAYALLCRVWMSAEEGDWVQAQGLLFRLLAAAPLWLGALSAAMAVLFNVRNNTVGLLVLAAFCLGGLGTSLRLAARTGVGWLARAAEACQALLLTAPFHAGQVPLWDTAYLGWCWGVGLLWTAGSTLLGLALFRGREL